MDKTNTVSNTKTKILVTSSLFSALICLTTAYILRIPIGGNGGYVHIGDAFIYLAAAILPKPYAIMCAAIGAGFADLVTGAAIWIIPTVIIKPILVLFISSKSDKIINLRNVLGTLVAGVVGTVLYMLAEGLVFGNFLAAFVFTSITFIQPIGSFIAFIIIGIAFDKLGIKKKFN
ncbi:MAG: TIGR04002 family protein [Peptostreptococcaceae bacterium]